MTKSYYADALQGAGTAAGASSAFGPERQAARAEARARKERSMQELEKLQKTRPSDEDYGNMRDAQSNEIKVLAAKQQEFLRQSNERTTYEGLRMYDKDPDPRHLNVLFNDLKKTGSKMFDHIARVDAVTEADTQLLEQQGLDPQFILNNEDIKRNMFKITKPDGTQVIDSLDKLKAATRYNQYATQEELASMKDRMQLMHVQSLGYYDGSTESVEAFRRAIKETGGADKPGFQDAYTKHLDELKKAGYKGRGRGGSEGLPGMGNPTEKEAEAHRRAILDGHEPGSPGYFKAMSGHMSDINSEWNRPSAERGVEAANTARTALDDMDFFNLDMSDLTNRTKASRYVNMIEKAGGVEIPVGQQTELMNLNEMIKLGDASKDLSDEQVGLIDRVFKNIRKYISDNTEGVAQASAFTAYRNIAKNALYGATLTATENKNFNDQLGTLGQQRGPILAQMRLALSQVRDNYETIANLNDPYVMHYRTGMSQMQLGNVLDAFDERIQMIDEAMGNVAVDASKVTIPAPKTPDELQGVSVLTEERRAGLDALRGRTQ